MDAKPTFSASAASATSWSSGDSAIDSENFTLATVTRSSFPSNAATGRGPRTAAPQARRQGHGHSAKDHGHSAKHTALKTQRYGRNAASTKSAISFPNSSGV